MLLLVKYLADILPSVSGVQGWRKEGPPSGLFGKAHAMQYYRLYFLSPASGHIVNFEAIEADADAQAIAIAAERTCFQPMELWAGARKLRRFDAIPVPAPEIRLRAGG
jgi:hypothetical protein